MTKYADIVSDVFSVFAMTAWADLNIATIPDNVPRPADIAEYVHVSVIPSGGGINIGSGSGILSADIYTPRGQGPLRAALIADFLDGFLVGNSLTSGEGTSQFLGSSFATSGIDKENPDLYKSVYSITFKHFVRS